jgi:putative hemin transport protein
MTASNLATRAQALQAEEPRLRARDLAARLGVSEAELLDARVGADVTRLRPDLRMILKKMPGVGRVMCLTRNDAAVHERRGTYTKGSMHGRFGLVVGPDIDLRLFPAHWSSAYRVQTQAGNRKLDSIQIFDTHGTASQKIYAEGSTDSDAWEALIADLVDEDQTAGQLSVESEPEAVTPSVPEDFDSEGFLEEWAGMQDTHDFFGMLRRSKLQYGTAFAVAEGRFTRRLDTGIARTLLEKAAELEIPIMVFVGNRGCIQIHTGPVKRIMCRSGWTNVLDPAFNLHLRDDLVHRAWAVTKPTSDGPVSSVELIDAEANVLVRFFGERKPGRPELVAWRALVDSLPTAT